MTYPPQQPSPYGGQNPWGQQPPQNPSNGPQQPGYAAPPQQAAPPGPYGQPGYNPYGQYGQPQPSHPNAPGGYPGGPPPKNNKTGLIVGISLVAVLLIGGGITTVVLVTGGGSGPMAVAKKVIKALNTQNTALGIKLSCNPDKPAIPQRPGAESIPEMHAEIAGEMDRGDYKATIPVRITRQGATNTAELVLVKRDGSWCVEDL